MQDQNKELETLFEKRLKRNAGTTIWTGVLIVLVGIIALSAPILVGVSIGILIGIVLLISGAGQLFFAYRSGEGAWPWIVGLLTLVAGGYMAGNASVAAATLTIALTIYLVFAGIADAVYALQLRPFDGWKFVFASGLLSLLLGVLIWLQFPLSGPFAIGIILGIKFLASAFLLISLGSAAKQLARSAQ